MNDNLNILYNELLLSLNGMNIIWTPFFHDVYEETINILRDIATRDGVLHKYDKSLRVDNYFPESLFYQFIGYPEHILINPIALELQRIEDK